MNTKKIISVLFFVVATAFGAVFSDTAFAAVGDSCVGSGLNSAGTCQSASNCAVSSTVRIDSAANCQADGLMCCVTISQSCQGNYSCIPEGACPSSSRGTTCGTGNVCCSNSYLYPSTSGAGSTTTSSAPFNYTPLEKIPGNEGASGDLGAWIQGIYRVALIIVTLSAVLMLTVGGFMYLTSAGNTSAMGSAKSVIFDSLIGLVIAITAWLILNVINPDLVSVTLNGVSTTPVTSGTPAAAGGAAGTAASASIAQRMANGSVPGVSVAGSGDCSSSAGVVSPQSSLQQAASGSSVTTCQSGCPSSGLCSGSVTGLNESMLNGIATVANRYPMTVSSFTGGSHSATSAHYSGRAADLVPSAAKADWPTIVLALRAQGASLVFCDLNGKNVSCDQANHIHAQW